MAATTMMMSTSAVLGGLQALPMQSSKFTKVGGAPPAPRLMVSLAGRVRCDAGQGKGPLADAKGLVDQVSKTPITKDDILRNQETNESEKQSVMGTKPAPSSGAPWPRPEIERRPETGSKSFFSVFAFDGAAPETINGRLAMLGFVWAVLAERATGLTVLQQVSDAGQPGLLYFLGTVQLLTYASLVPIMSGESTDSRKFGPFTAQAERWNGRVAMIGFFGLVITELFTHSAVFGGW